ncbi:MAG: hypothetical protein IKP95_11305 [Ruminococcus sp.]|nr:hypothetical protein [Ruminococcus sp.]
MKTTENAPERELDYELSSQELKAAVGGVDYGDIPNVIILQGEQVIRQLMNQGKKRDETKMYMRLGQWNQVAVKKYPKLTSIMVAKVDDIYNMYHK